MIDIVIERYKNLLLKMLTSPQVLFDGNLARALPYQGGVYRIFEKSAEPPESLYFGKTGASLYGRVYDSLLMGNLSRHTLKRKLIDKGRCSDQTAAKEYLKEFCCVQVLILEDDLERTRFEHFAIAVLQPELND